jgi:hypothetical protein
MFRVYEFLNGKFHDISPADGCLTEAAAFAAARTGYREHLVILVSDSKLIAAIYGFEESTGTATFGW